MPIFGRRHLRIARAKRAAAESAQIKETIDAQWDEIHELSRWAREVPQRPEELTRLFLRTLGGHS